MFVNEKGAFGPYIILMGRIKKLGTSQLCVGSKIERDTEKRKLKTRETDLSPGHG
jgi:hypothetical protein